MFRPTRPSSGALKYGDNCRAFCTAAICVFVITMFLNEANVVPRSMPDVLSP
jgi:hypothetical protein